MRNFLRYWLPVIVLCAVIFWQSCFATPHVLPSWPLQDKMAHAGIYGVLAALWIRAFNSLESWSGRRRLLLTTGVVLSTLYGLSDEWHQSFVPTRTADAFDLMADFGGSLIGSWIYLRFFIQRPNLTSPNPHA
jgi:VanZ family protein